MKRRRRSVLEVVSCEKKVKKQDGNVGNGNIECLSDLQKCRLNYEPSFPRYLNCRPLNHFVSFSESSASIHDEIYSRFPSITSNHCYTLWSHDNKDVVFDDDYKTELFLRDSCVNHVRIGVVVCGGLAPGIWNVIWGMNDIFHEQMEQVNGRVSLFAFLGGPKGLIQGKYIKLDKEFIDYHRNMGGIEPIGIGRDSLSGQDSLSKAEKVCDDLDLSSLILIGGADSQVDAARLAQYFSDMGSQCSILSIPKTINNNLKNEEIEICLGFDSASKVYSESLGNILTDSASAKKHWHFVRMMGRVSSHLVLECSLQCHPHLSLIGEELRERDETLEHLSNRISTLIEKRSDACDANGGGLGEFGVIVFSEGLLEFMPRMERLMEAVNSLLSKKIPPEYIRGMLPVGGDNLQALYDSIPIDIRRQFMKNRDPHGNVALSQIETEKLLMKMALDALSQRGSPAAKSFSAVPHFLGYEGRSVMPSNFDCDYGYTLGRAAGLFAISQAKSPLGNLTGYLISVRNLGSTNHGDWVVVAAPICSMLEVKQHSQDLDPTFAFSRGYVDLNGRAFIEMKKQRGNWAGVQCEEDDCDLLDEKNHDQQDHGHLHSGEEPQHRNPGPIQYFGEQANRLTLTLSLSQENSE